MSATIIPGEYFGLENFWLFSSMMSDHLPDLLGAIDHPLRLLGVCLDPDLLVPFRGVQVRCLLSLLALLGDEGDPEALRCERPRDVEEVLRSNERLGIVGKPLQLLPQLRIVALPEVPEGLSYDAEEMRIDRRIVGLGVVALAGLGIPEADQRHHLLGQRGPAELVVGVQNVEEVRSGVEVVAEGVVLLVRRIREDGFIDVARRGLLFAHGVRQYS